MAYRSEHRRHGPGDGPEHHRPGGGRRGSCSVLNAGTFRKSAGIGTSAIQGLTFNNEGVLVTASGSMILENSTFNNTGETRVDAGELILAGGGASSGRLITTSDTAVIFQSGSPHLLAGAQFLGTGWYRIRGATVAFDGAAAVPQLELNSGSLGGAGTLTVTNALVWNGSSTMTGGGTTVIGLGATATLSGTGDRSFVTRTLVNQGTVLQQAPSRLTFYSGSRVENQAGGLVDWQGDVNWTYTGGGSCSVLNAGTWRKSAGSGTGAFEGLTPNQAGRMEAQVGSIVFPNGVVATGTFDAAAGATIRFQDTCWLTSPLSSLKDLE